MIKELSNLMDAGTACDSSIETMTEELFKVLSEKYPDEYSINEKNDDSPRLKCSVEEMDLDLRDVKRQFINDVYRSAVKSSLALAPTEDGSRHITKIKIPSRKRIKEYAENLLTALDTAINKDKKKKFNKWALVIKLATEDFMSMLLAIDYLFLINKISLPSNNTYEYKYQGFNFYIVENTEIKDKIIVSFAKLRDVRTGVDICYKKLENQLKDKQAIRQEFI